MKQKFTPGPWVVVEEDHDIAVSGEGWFDDQNVNGWAVVGNLDNPDMAIAVIDTGYKNSWNDSQLDANARLIAAAPDLLEALQWALAEIEGRTRYAPNNHYEAKEQRENASDAAHAAIAKALGK